ncbi:MFS transporter [Novosphingobium sp. Gsoil 351]|uniref:MFS transporter n=1 Tax=Novosphingobium sp. Gsoil 351 TaxID=2675225 RepID=UPI0018A842BB|nr:MFS transporter [Novosphingobium sp. Gsoil 351]
MAVVLYLLLLQFLYSWSWSSSDVLRPLFRRLYGLSLAQAGLAYSAQVGAALIGALLVGRVQHRAGRKHTLSLVAAGCGLSLAAGALVDGLAALFVQRLALGLFMGAVFPVTVGLVVDMFPPGQRGRLASLVDATYFSAVIALGWAAAALIPLDWRLLFWPVGGSLVLLSFGAHLLALAAHPEDHPRDAPRARDLFAPPLRAQTLALTAMISVNACGHQAFVGWLTVYLSEVDRVSAAGVAATLTASYLGSISGCFVWGFVVDRFGRRAGGRGLIAAGVFSAAFVLLPAPLWARQVAVFGFGFAFAAIATIGPWLAELYPARLRAPATSIFQWGRCLSLVAPPLTGFLAERFGLPAVMTLAAVAFAMSGLIWRRLPETHHQAWRSTVLQPNLSGR